MAGVGDSPTFEFNASPYTTAELAAAAHAHELPAATPSIELCVDHQMMGVGGDSAATQSVHPAYALRPSGGTCEWTVQLTPRVAPGARGDDSVPRSAQTYHI